MTHFRLFNLYFSIVLSLEMYQYPIHVLYMHLQYIFVDDFMSIPFFLLDDLLFAAALLDHNNLLVMSTT